MHMHTVLGAYDSSLKPDDLATEATRVGLTGVNISEHDRLWDRWRAVDKDLDAYAARRPGRTAVVVLEPVAAP